MTWLPVSDGFARSACGRFDLIRTPDRIPGGWLWLVIDGEHGRTYRGYRADCEAWAYALMYPPMRFGASQVAYRLRRGVA